MKRLLLVGLAIALMGCATSNPKKTASAWEWFLDPPCPGTRYYDPQVCKGQSFGPPLPNQPYEALVRYDRGERW